MKRTFFFVVTIIFVQLSNLTFANSLTPKLLLGIDIVRHGDRAPVKWLPGILDGIWKKEDMGKLTSKGIKESTILGQELYSYYSKYNLLSHDTNLNDIYISSTNTSRTIDTARAIANGLFPNKSAQIEIHTLSCYDSQCTAFDEYKTSENKISDIQKELIPTNLKKLLIDSAKHVDRHYNTNFSSSGIFGISKLGGALAVGDLHNKPRPKHISRKLADDLISAYRKRYMYVWSIPARNCNHSKWMMSQIKDTFDSKIEKKSPIKFKLMTMHDVNLVPILRFLDFPIISKPKYNADLRFELFELEDKYYVKASFDGQSIKICSTEFCTVEEFYKMIDNQFSKQCDNYEIDYDYLKAVNIN